MDLTTLAEVKVRDSRGLCKPAESDQPAVGIPSCTYFNGLCQVGLGGGKQD